MKDPTNRPSSPTTAGGGTRPKPASPTSRDRASTPLLQLEPPPVGGRLIPALSELAFSTATEMAGDGFPYDVPDELTATQAAEVDTILSEGPPGWVRAIRRWLGR